jgi:uncharacterized membrane protein
MKAVTTMPTKAYAKPSAAYNQVWEKIDTEKMARIADKTLSVCLTVIVITGLCSLFSTIATQLAGRQIITHFSQAMSHVIYMVY